VREEFFILNDFVPGEGYYRDLERLHDGGDPQGRGAFEDKEYIARQPVSTTP
jgi:hypothetical protein